MGECLTDGGLFRQLLIVVNRWIVHSYEVVDRRLCRWCFEIGEIDVSAAKLGLEINPKTGQSQKTLKSIPEVINLIFVDDAMASAEKFIEKNVDVKKKRHLPGHRCVGIRSIDVENELFSAGIPVMTKIFADFKKFRISAASFGVDLDAGDTDSG